MRAHAIPSTNLPPSEQTLCDNERMNEGMSETLAVPVAWIDDRQLLAARKDQEVWDSVSESDRAMAMDRLAVIGLSLELIERGVAAGDADADAGRRNFRRQMSASTVGKWRRRYRGGTAIERLVSLLDQRLRYRTP